MRISSFPDGNTTVDRVGNRLRNGASVQGGGCRARPAERSAAACMVMYTPWLAEVPMAVARRSLRVVSEVSVATVHRFGKRRVLGRTHLRLTRALEVVARVRRRRTAANAQQPADASQKNRSRIIRVSTERGISTLYRRAFFALLTLNNAASEWHISCAHAEWSRRARGPRLSLSRSDRGCLLKANARFCRVRLLRARHLFWTRRDGFSPDPRIWLVGLHVGAVSAPAGSRRPAP